MFIDNYHNAELSMPHQRICNHWNIKCKMCIDNYR